MRRRWLVVVLLVFLLCVACNAKPIISTVSPLSPLVSPRITSSATATPMPEGIAPPPGLIYKTQNGLWRIDSDSKPARLLALDAGHMSFEVAPKGDRVLYWDWNEGDILLGDLRTGETRNLTNSPTRFECCPLWWPERSEMILFASQSSTDRPWGSTLLIAKNLGSGDLQIIDRSGSFIGPAAFSPDGTSLAYSKNGQPVVCQSEQGCTSFNLADFGVSITTTRGAGGPAWSPNGESIAWTVSSFYSDTQEFGTGIFNLRERNWRLLHPYGPIGRDSFGFPSLLWSPDSNWLVMQVDTRNPVTGQEEISQQVIHVGSEYGEEHRVDLGPLVWSPDSLHLILSHRLIDVNTWRAQPLALPPDAEVVAWINPDSQ